MDILKRCSDCAGTGSVKAYQDPHGAGTTTDCPTCDATGYVKMADIDLSDMIDTMNDIMNKCNDIKEKCDEIYDAVTS